MILFDHECPNCGTVFEALRQSATSTEAVECTDCGQTVFAKKLLSAPRMDPRLGVDSAGFPTMGEKWIRRRKQHQRIEERRKREHSA